MFELFQNESDGKYYFRLKTEKGQVLLTSGPHVSRIAAQQAIEVAKDTTRNVSEDSIEHASLDSKTTWNLNDRITIEVGKMGGRPCIRGMRISVYDILSWLASGMSFDDVLVDFPELELEDIYASLQFAANKQKHTYYAVS